MKIHFFVRSLRKDGAGSHQNAIAFVRYLMTQGHSVIVHAITSFNDPPADIHFFGHGQEKLGFRETNVFLAKLLSNLEQDTDLFFLDGVDFVWGAGQYRRRGGTKPVIIYADTCTGTMNIGKRPNLIYYLKRLAWEKFVGLRDAQWVDRYIAASPFIEEVFVRYGFPADKFSIVTNFFGFSDIQRSYERKPVCILYAGRLTYDKGLDLLIDAAKLLERGAWRMHIVGEGPIRAQCEDMVRSHGLDKIITFESWASQSDMPKIYASADIFVHPSRVPEAFGRSYVEAMGTGMPVIASQIGAAPWVVGHAGILFKKGSVSDLRDAMSRLIQDSGLRAQLGAQGLERVKAFSADVVGPRLEKLLESVAHV